MWIWLVLGCLMRQANKFSDRVTVKKIKKPTHLEMFTHCSLHEHYIPFLQETNDRQQDVAQKYDGKRGILNYFAVRATFHHTTAIGDVPFPQASQTVKKLLYAECQKPMYLPTVEEQHLESHYINDQLFWVGSLYLDS